MPLVQKVDYRESCVLKAGVPTCVLLEGRRCAHLIMKSENIHLNWIHGSLCDRLCSCMERDDVNSVNCSFEHGFSLCI